MEEKKFENIIEKFNLNKLEKIQISDKTKKNSIVFKINYEKKNYILKILENKTKEEFNLIIYTIELIKNLKIPKLLFFKYYKNKSYFIFEYLNGKKDFSQKDTINFLKKFYKKTSNTKINNFLNCDFFKKYEELLNYLEEPLKYKIKEILFELKKNSQKKIILTDINSSNSIYFKNNFYFFDFDEVLIGEIEWDLAYLYIDLKINSLFEENSLKFLKELNFEILKKFDIDKLNKYIILVLVFKSIQEKKEIYTLNLQKLLLKNTFFN